MIFRYPEMEEVFHSAPVPLQVVFREFENIVLVSGIEPIIYKIMPGHTGPMTSSIRRIDIQCGPFLYSEKLIDEIIEGLKKKYGSELIVAHRKKHDHIPERLILEIPETWVEQPKIFLKRFGYIKGGNHG